MAGMNDVKAHPVLNRQIAHSRMLHEQIGAPLGEQRSINLIPEVQSSQEMRFRDGPRELRRRHGALRRFPARREPAQSENEEPGDLLGGAATAAAHRGMIASSQERFGAQRNPQRQMLDDLSGCPFAGGSALPIAVGTSAQRSEDEIRQLAERLHEALA